MPMPREEISRSQLKTLISHWADEYGVAEDGEMHYPFQPNKTGSLIQVFWDLYETGRVNTVPGLKAYFHRYADVVKLR